MPAGERERERRLSLGGVLAVRARRLLPAVPILPEFPEKFPVESIVTTLLTTKFNWIRLVGEDVDDADM